MDVRTFLRENRKKLATLLFVIMFVLVISRGFEVLFLSPDRDSRTYVKPSSKFPSSFNTSRFHNVETDTPFEGVSTEIWGYTEFGFFDDLKGGVTGSHMVIYNDFHNPTYAVAIIHHFYIIALYEYQLITQDNNGSWIQSEIHYSWEHPNNSMLFLSIATRPRLSITSGDLIVGDYINGPGYSWLDLGELNIGGSDRSLSGYNFLSIDYGNTQARKTYHNGENIIYNGFLSVKRLKRFIVRDDITW
ncbi:MAG: hypothetical protein FK730_14850 [Asgard group archaeon]|nr:hypothetical protein [Asgard group archaeon]